MNRIVNATLPALLAASVGAHAYPEGAPWGAADPDAREPCASCHYDYDPVHESPALSIEGLPDVWTAGERYELLIRFAPVGATVSGFQLLAAAEDGAGRFLTGSANVESIGAASRSTQPQDSRNGASWSVTWQAPRDGCSPVRLYLAASAANDDQSPLGDTVHYRKFIVGPQSGDDT